MDVVPDDFNYRYVEWLMFLMMFVHNHDHWNVFFARISSQFNAIRGRVMWSHQCIFCDNTTECFEPGASL